jgi:hypothetical protein
MRLIDELATATTRSIGPAAGFEGLTPQQVPSVSRESRRPPRHPGIEARRRPAPPDDEAIERSGTPESHPTSAATTSATP